VLGVRRRAAQRRAHLARLVKGRALECLSVVGTAVGAERFGPDAVVAMQGIVGLLGASSRGRSGEPAVSGDDPVLMFLWEAVRRIARVIGSEAFAPFVDAIVPQLLIATRAETRVTKIQFGPKTDLDMVADAASDAPLQRLLLLQMMTKTMTTTSTRMKMLGTPLSYVLRRLL